MKRRWSWIVVTGVLLGAAWQVSAQQPGGAPAPGRPQPGGSALILGRVVDAATNQPIAMATVSLGGGAPPSAQTGLPSAPPSSMSNADGYFLFRDLRKASGYMLTAQASGYLNGTYGQRRPEQGPGAVSRQIPLNDDERVTDVVIRLWRVAAIGGTVTDEAGEPVPGLSVRVMRHEGSHLTAGYQAQTDDRGIYRVGNLVPGDYLVGFFSSVVAVPSAIAPALQNTTSPISLDLRRDVPGLPFLGALGSLGGTTDVGDMRLLPSLLSGITAPQPGPDGRLRAYPTTFAPGTTSPDTAQTVRIASGQERMDADIRMRLTTMFSVSGAVTGPDGPMPNLGLRLLPASAGRFTTESGIETAATASGADGRFTFLGVPPGSYEIVAQRTPRPSQPQQNNFTTVINYDGGGTLMMSTGLGVLTPAPDGPTLWTRTSVDVANRDLTGVAVLLRPGARLIGSVEFDGGPPPRTDMPRFGIGVVRADERATQLPQPVPIDDQLRFATAQYPAGRYLLTVSSPPAGWSVVSARVGGTNALEHPFTLEGEDETNVLVTMSKRTTEISGTVRGNGPGDPNAVVIVFPSDYQTWIDEGMTSRRVRTVDVRPDGTYRAQNLAPGDYALVAVSAAVGVDTRDPGVYPALMRAASRVTVAAGDSKSQPLTVSVVR